MNISIPKNKFDILIPTTDISSRGNIREYSKLKFEYKKQKYKGKVDVVPTVYGIVVQNIDKLPNGVIKSVQALRIYTNNETKTIEFTLDRIEKSKIEKALRLVSLKLPSAYLELKSKTDYTEPYKHTKAVIEINILTIEHIHLIDGKKDNSTIGIPTVNILNSLNDIIYQAIIKERA